MDNLLREKIAERIKEIRTEGLYKDERIIMSSQRPRIRIAAGEVVNFCANNYLGLSAHPDIVDAARRGLQERGFGMSSVRFICGTQDIHKELEEKISRFIGAEDTILYSSCFDANAGLFETLLDKDDVIISDELNHASIIDGVRLCKARRSVYKHADMADLESRLREASDAKVKMIATDGVFSMDGDYAPLDAICDLAERYGATVMVDDSHATGFVGQQGRGTPEFFGTADRVDIITSTLGKALGGASGGFTSGRAEVIEYLRQRSRPYLFSNSLAPPIVFASLTAIDLIADGDDLRTKLRENTAHFRNMMKKNGFKINESDHPIVPIMIGGAEPAHAIAQELLEEGIYVIGFSYPVVPKGRARIRAQISAAHTTEELDRAVSAFSAAGKRHGLIG